MHPLANPIAINLAHVLLIALLSIFFTYPDTCLIYTDALFHVALHM